MNALASMRHAPSEPDIPFLPPGMAVAHVRELLDMLRSRLEGEARFDLYSRTLYSTDASLYQVRPLGVVLPRTIDDVHATLEASRIFGIPITARGGGSSLAGQAIGPGIVLDFTKYMHNLLEVDAEARTARVEPGLVLDRLNHALRPHGLMYGPDPASANRSAMGGVIGADASGSHSILYGMTHDHVRSLRVLLSDGTETSVEALSPEQLAGKMALSSFEGEIYRLTHRLVEQHRSEIAERFPQHWRAVSGYGMDRLVGEGPWNLASLLCGSEGTLALTLEATVSLVPRPRMTGLAVLHYRSLPEAMEAVPALLELGPSAIELLDDFLIDLTRGVPEFARKLTFMEGFPRCVLLVEFYGESTAELDGRFQALREMGRRINTGYATVELRSAEQMANVWAVRKAGVGLLMSTTSEWKPIPFIEDGSVPPAQLATFVREVEAILEEHGVQAAMYAHASAGCLHIRPLLNIKQAEDIRRMRSIAEAWLDLLLRLRGAPSGEHGDGRSRSEWNEALFGPQLYGAFCALKDGWDPEGLFNPGLIVRAQSMTENLRYGPHYSTEEPPTLLSFEKFGGYAGAVEMCSGIGACRKTGSGVMCPSYMATREEEHSTRGRANALRSALSGVLPREELFSERMHDVLDLCLACKACSAECPSQVDMAKIKYEFLYHYNKEHGLRLRNRLFGMIRLLNRLGSATAPLSNVAARGFLGRMIQARIGIAPERSLPEFAPESFDRWFRAHRAHPSAGRAGSVVLFPDTFTFYNYPEMGRAATHLLEAAGYQVLLPPLEGCCGRPMLSNGMLEEARANLTRIVDSLMPYAMMGLPIIGLEPSCLLTFREEALDLLTDKRAARAVADRAVLIDEWLVQQHAAGGLEYLEWNESERTILLHGHCHHKASGIRSAVEALNLPPGYHASLIDAGCCGMAGGFGFEAEHYEISERIGEDRLFPAIRNAPDAAIAVTGVSCRQQIAHFTGRQPRHLVEWLAMAIR